MKQKCIVIAVIMLAFATGCKNRNSSTSDSSQTEHDHNDSTYVTSGHTDTSHAVSSDHSLTEIRDSGRAPIITGQDSLDALAD